MKSYFLPTPPTFPAQVLGLRVQVVFGFVFRVTKHPLDKHIRSVQDILLHGLSHLCMEGNRLRKAALTHNQDLTVCSFFRSLIRGLGSSKRLGSLRGSLIPQLGTNPVNVFTILFRLNFDDATLRGALEEVSESRNLEAQEIGLLALPILGIMNGQLFVDRLTLNDLFNS